jgi:hypothetical protein
VGQLLACATGADPLEQLGGRDPQRLCELGDGTNAGLALGALDLGDVGHVEVGIVSEAFLAEAAFLPEPSQVGSEDVERVGHGPTMLRHLSQ